MAIYSGFSHWKWWFSIVMWQFTRGYGEIYALTLKRCFFQVWQAGESKLAMEVLKISWENHRQNGWIVICQGWLPHGTTTTTTTTATTTTYYYYLLLLLPSTSTSTGTTTATTTTATTTTATTTTTSSTSTTTTATTITTTTTTFTSYY